MTRRNLSSILFVLGCTAPCAFGGTTATFDLVGTNNGANSGGVYTSPYYADITTGNTTVSTAAICDDFSDDSYLNESWTANVTTGFSSLNTTLNTAMNNSTVKWQGTTWNGTVLTQAQEYMAAAILADDLLPIAATNPTLAGEYGYGIWALTYTGTSANSPQTYFNDNSTWSTIEGYVNTAVTDATSVAGYDSPSSYSNVTIYSYASGATGCPGGCAANDPPQEFLVVGMPEPSMSQTALFYFSALACVAFVFRRRIFGNAR